MIKKLNITTSFYIIGILFVYMINRLSVSAQNETEVSKSVQKEYAYLSKNFVSNVEKSIKERTDEIESKTSVDIRITSTMSQYGNTTMGILIEYLSFLILNQPGSDKLLTFATDMNPVIENDKINGHHVQMDLFLHPDLKKFLPDTLIDSAKKEMNNLLGPSSKLESIKLKEAINKGLDIFNVEKIKGLEKYFVAPKDSITSAAEAAVELANAFTGNTTTAGCNICTRGAVYITTGKGNKDIFPKSGSYLGKEKETPYLKGEVKEWGKANDIADDLKNKVLIKYVEIADMAGEDYPDFEQLQKDVNTGQIVIGAYHGGTDAGHVVMIVPGTAEAHKNKPKDYVYNNGISIKFPEILECGYNHRESKIYLYKNININTKVKEMRWYKLLML